LLPDLACFSSLLTCSKKFLGLPGMTLHVLFVGLLRRDVTTWSGNDHGAPQG
jgi:hypothetical protein